MGTVSKRKKMTDVLVGKTAGVALAALPVLTHSSMYLRCFVYEFKYHGCFLGLFVWF